MKSIGNFVCLKAVDGTPLFSRSYNGSKELPFQIIGTLNSIFTIGDKYGFRIDSLDSTEFKIIWKMYQSNLTLILIEPIEPVDESYYFRKLDLLFDAMVLMYGLEDLINITNVDKFKLEIKIMFPIIDLILNTPKNFDLFGGYLTNTVDLILELYEPQDIVSYQTALQSSCQEINTSYACIFINGRVLTASPAWWEFKPAESYLISLLCMTFSKATSIDTPIYLPYKNPNQPLRLLMFNLCSSLSLCFICSDEPGIDKAELIVKKIWHPIYKSLVNLKLSLPKNIPKHLSVDQNMIAFLLINKKSKCCASSLCSNEKINSNIPEDQIQYRYELLKYCYLNMSTNYFHKISKIKKELYEEDLNEKTICSEAYALLFDHKCYALNEENFEFYALFNKQIPTYALRGVSKTCFQILINSSK